MKKIKIASLILVVCLGALFPQFVRGASGEPEPEETQCHYCDLIMPLLVGGLIGPQEKTLIFSVRTPEGTIPPPGPNLEILSNSATIVLDSDADGFVHLPFNINLVRENPPVNKLYDRQCSYEARLTCVFHKGIKQRVELDTRGKPSLGEGPLKVWYPPGLEKDAKATLEHLEQAAASIRSELGIEPASWGINLIGQDLSAINHTTLQYEPKWYTWSYSVDEMATAESRQNTVHEWVEYSLEKSAGLSQSSEGGSNRFVFDGLADYVSNRFSNRFSSEYSARLEQLLADGITSVNLPREFTFSGEAALTSSNKTFGFTAGYPLSYAFWERVSEQHGRDIPKRFLAAVHKEGAADYETCLRILKQLTGSETLRQELEAMDVAAALELIQKTGYPEAGKKSSP